LGVILRLGDYSCKGQRCNCGQGQKLHI
jgi:hypothetical protein